MPVWLIVMVLGIVEGITEFIPISSTGHLIIVEKLFALSGALGADHWLVKAGWPKDLFNVVIQSGAVLAVIPLFRERFKQFLFGWREVPTQLYMAKVAVAFGITGLGGLILEKMNFKLPEEVLPVALALLIGGVLFVLFEARLKGRKLMDEITWGVVIAVGLGQLIAAVFPGTSRSGSTILMALAFGLNRVAATEFTFLVGIPTMLAAGGLKIFKGVQHAADAPADYWTMVGLGSLVAAAVSFMAVKWLLRYVQTHTFVLFGWYRIAAAALLLALVRLA